jgi:hypothetical protein
MTVVVVLVYRIFMDTCNLFFRKIKKKWRAPFLQMLYRVFAYLDVKMVSQTVCKVVSANLVVTILTDTVCELFDTMAKFVS